MLCWYESTKTEQWFAPPSLHLPHSSAGIWSGAFMRTIQKHRNKYWISKYFWDILRRNRISRYATCTKKRFVLAKKREKKRRRRKNRNKDFFKSRNELTLLFLTGFWKERRKRETERKEQRRASPGNKLEIMDLFDIRPQSGQPILRGTRPNCN